MDLNFGIRGSGKGTQKPFSWKLQWFESLKPARSFMRLANEDSELTRKVKTIMEARTRIPTEVVP